MKEEEYNILCYNFQQKIINIFNQTELPFLLKYYLFKQVWKIIKNYKKQINQQIFISKNKKIKEIPLEAQKKKQKE